MAVAVRGFETGPVATFGYLVYDEETKEAVIIDAPLQSFEPIVKVIEENELAPGALILTHTHWDHTGDAAKFKAAYPNMLVYVHECDQYRMTEPMKHTVWALPFTIEAIDADRHLAHDDMFELGPIHFQVIHTPGHTEGGICLYDEQHKLLFAGDTLFSGSVGRTDLPGGDMDILVQSIEEKLLVLPDDVRVFPGHGPATTIGAERESNPFIRG